MRADAHDHGVHAIGERGLVGEFVVGGGLGALRDSGGRGLGGRVELRAGGRRDGGLVRGETVGLAFAHIHKVAAFGIFLVACRNLELRQRLVLDAHECPLA